VVFDWWLTFASSWLMWVPNHVRISRSKKLPGITGSLKQARINKRYSKIRMAEAITVVHKPFLSPTADCVLFAVRTILFDIL